MASVIPKIGSGQGRFGLPRFGLGERSIPLISDHSDKAFVESFRLLALNVRTLTRKANQESLAIISAFSGDGRSTIAANLALALAEKTKVLLYDGDDVGSRRLSDTAALGADEIESTRRGPSDASLSRTGLWLTKPIQQPSSNGAGDLDQNAQRLLEEGAFTIVDLPPASTSSTAFTLARWAGAVIYVIRRRPQDMTVHRRIREHLARLDVDLIGLVVNEY